MEIDQCGSRNQVVKAIVQCAIHLHIVTPLSIKKKFSTGILNIL